MISEHHVSLWLQVLLDVRVLLALQVLVIKERREVKQQQVTQDHRVTLATLVLEASRSVYPIVIGATEKFNLVSS